MSNQKAIDGALSLGRPECYAYMSDDEYRDGVAQAVADLDRLARQDGCIAASVALAIFEHQQKERGA